MSEAGKIIAGKYETIKVLGQGSFGTVYLVRHVDLGVRYALKILKPNLSTSEEFLDRFRREAGIMLRFSHPGSVQLRDFGRTEDNLYYMALDFCEGRVLEDIINRYGRLSVVDALDLMIQILSVLEAAHGMNIIHRDIKSANVMVESGADGALIPRILDFGIAKLRDETVSVGTNVTTDGITIGTPDYMSPEQASGQADLDCRVDLYAAGVLMYEMIAGGVPFRGSTVIQTLLKHLTQPVPPFPRDFGVPPTVFRIILKALEKERDRRYASARDFRVDCEEALEWLKKELVQNLQPPSATQATPAVEVPAAPEPAKPRLLCLDDNEMILQIVRHIFEKEGYKVYTASSFSMIHDHVFKDHAELMLCDVNMPGLPGPKICRMLKKAKADLKIVLFSNIDERDLERLAMSCRADGWLSKNASPDQWISKVREMAEPQTVNNS